jgi:hypothetical protein
VKEETVIDSSSDDGDWWDGVYGTFPGEDMDSEEALLDACKDNDIDAVLDLIGDDIQKSEVNLDCRVPMNHPNPPIYSRSRRSVMYEDSAFHICCARGHQELVDFFIQREECDFTMPDMDKLTPLHAAVASNHIDIVKALVKSQRVPNMLPAVDRSGRTCMYVAVGGGGGAKYAKMTPRT